MKKLPALLLLFCALTIQAQRDYYWVKFKDKDSNPFSLANPQAYLTDASIERRSFQHIQLDSTDLPLTPAYVNGLSPFIDYLKHRLKWLNMVVVKVTTPANLDSIKALPYVDTLGPIYYVPPIAGKKSKFEDWYAPVDQTYSQHPVYGAGYRQINQLNADLLHQLGYRGQGILMGMMDNGIYRGDLVTGLDSVRSRIIATWDFVHDEENVYNDGSHGLETFSCVAGNVPGKFLGTAPDASFVLSTTEDDGAEWVMEEYNWAAGAEFADSLGARIFSTSLGYTDFDNDTGSHTYADMTGNKTVITRAANIAATKGILVINSAGNEGNNSWHYIAAPADGDKVIAIGALDSASKVQGFSSKGPNAAGRVKPDLCAMGARAGILDPYGYVTTNNGTSFSCPIMAGCFASLWSAFPEKTADEIYTAVVISADHFWEPDSSFGYGIPNFYNAYILLKYHYNGNILQISPYPRVFPNPFSETLNISYYNEGKDGTHKLELFNLQGQLVLSREVYMRANTFEVFTIDDAGKLNAGTYVFRFDGDKKFSSQVIKFNKF